MNIPILVSLYLLVVVVPIIFWMLFFRWLDRKEPEPGRFLFRIFRFGFLAIILALAVEIIIDRTFFPEAVEFMSSTALDRLDPAVLILILASFFLAGPVEEAIKYFVLKRVTFQSPEFNQVIDGVIYGTTLALGFVLIENTCYFYDIYANMSEQYRFMIVLFRGAATTLLHVVSTGIIGLYLGRSKFEEKESNWLALKGLVIASLIHGLFNVFLFFKAGLVLNVLLVTVAAIWLVFEFGNKEFRKIRFAKYHDDAGIAQ